MATFVTLPERRQLLTTLLLSSTFLLPLCHATKAVRMSTGPITSSNGILKRDTKPSQVNLGNAITHGLYYVNCTIGSPAQTVQLQLDTGSSDVWMFSPQSCPSTSTDCFGYSYDASQSSTYQLLAEGQFEISYVTAGSGVTGDYFSDTLVIGESTITNLTMAVANEVKAVEVGIMGVGFDTDESIVASDGSEPYPNLIDVMVTEGLINSRAYSLYLDDLEASTGSIIFGGYDTARFTDDLITIPIQPDATSGDYSSFTVAMTSLVWKDSSGTVTLTSDDYAVAAVLDSGTTTSVIDDDLALTIINSVGAVPIDSSGDSYAISCSLNATTATLDYGFSGSDGPVISVPFYELVGVPITDDDGKILSMDDGSDACLFGIEPANDRPLLLGDTFLRSAYVVYDIDNLQISLAQANFDTSSKSNIIEIDAAGVAGNSTGTGSGGVSAGASAGSSVVSGATAKQTASLKAGIGGLVSSATGGEATLTATATTATGAAGASTKLPGLVKTTAAVHTGTGATAAASASKSAATTGSIKHGGAAGRMGMMVMWGGDCAVVGVVGIVSVVVGLVSWVL